VVTCGPNFVLSRVCIIDLKRRLLIGRFLKGMVATAIISSPILAKAAQFIPSLRFLRPPGVHDEDDFLSACIRCGQCAEVCPNNAIKFFGTDNGLKSIDTPYIVPREQACILCMKCGDVCPTGAIPKIERTQEAIVSEVGMGKAQVNKDLCLSWQGKSCGVCYRACPLPNIAIKVGYMEQPEVLDACVGCGLCERSCIQMPQAIKIIPTHVISAKV